MHSALDEVEAHEGPAALVTTATGKFYTNGLDTTWIFAEHRRSSRVPRQGTHAVHPLADLPDGDGCGDRWPRLRSGRDARTSHDFQIMRADRGFYCLPEVSLNMPFTVGMSALLNSRLPKQAAVEAMTTGRRFGGADALSAGIVQETVEGDSVLATAVAKAAALTATHGPNLVPESRPGFTETCWLILDG